MISSVITRHCIACCKQGKHFDGVMDPRKSKKTGEKGREPMYALHENAVMIQTPNTVHA